jgi:hypothetical protein
MISKNEKKVKDWTDSRTCWLHTLYGAFCDFGIFLSQNVPTKKLWRNKVSQPLTIYIDLLLSGLTILKIGSQDSLIFGSPKENTGQHLADKKSTARLYMLSGAIMSVTIYIVAGTIINILIIPGLVLFTIGSTKRLVQTSVKIHKSYFMQLFAEANAIAKQQGMT